MQAGAWMLPAVSGVLCPVPILVGPCETRKNYNQNRSLGARLTAVTCADFCPGQGDWGLGLRAPLLIAEGWCSFSRLCTVVAEEL